MKLTREAVLELMGRSHDLHSCVLTTYSFDPLFFDLKILRILFGAGIRNVLVLVDAGMYAHALEEAHANLRQSGSYGLLPVFMDGAYHPKMIAAVGERSGFLAVGSGNLTAGGHGGNDEIWAAFHVNGPDSPYTPLFAKAWSILRAQANDAEGSCRERLEWMTEHAPWLADLDRSGEGEASVRGNWMRLVTGPDDGLLTLLEDRVGERAVRRITVISPYFDNQGALLSHLRKRWPDAVLDVVVEDRTGRLPLEIPDKLRRELNWYPWRLAPIQREDERMVNNRRLHAKAVIFKLQRGGDVGYLGSANCSVAAWGTDRVDPLNAEAGLLLEWPNGGLLEHMGLDNAAWQPMAWNELLSGVPEDTESDAGNDNYGTPLLLVEQDGEELTVYPQKAYAKPCVIEVSRRGDEPVFQHMLEALPKGCTVKVVEDLTEGVCIVRAPNGTVLSNKLIVQNAQAHRACNPDKQQAKLSEVISLISAGQVEQIENLLKYAVFDSNDEAASLNLSNRSPGARRAQEEDGKRLDTYEEFTSVSAELMAQQKGLLYHANVRIADVLAGLSVGLEQSIEILDDQRDVEVDLEQDAGREDTEPIIKPRTIEAQALERNAVERFLKKYKAHLDELAVRSVRDHEVIPLTLQEQSRFLIASWLMLSYAGRRFKDPNGQELNEQFLGLQGKYAWDNIRDFSELVLFDHLVLCDNGLVSYPVPSVERKMQAFTKEALVRALLIICVQSWSELEYSRFDMLALNVLYRMHKLKIPLEPGIIEAWMKQHDSDQFIRSRYYGFNLHRLIKVLVPEVLRLAHMDQEAKKEIATSGAGLRKSDLVFSSRFGFGSIERVIHVGNGIFEVAYFRPGDADALEAINLKSAIRIHLEPVTSKHFGKYRAHQPRKR